jgi:hypothetical protein
MTANELKRREVASLKSTDSTIRERGIAFRDIYNRWFNSATPWLSEDVDISDVAQAYFAEQKHEYEKYGKKNSLVRMRAAADLFVTTLSKSNTLEFLLSNRVEAFGDLERLRSKPEFSKLSPALVREALDKLLQKNPTSLVWGSEK